MNYKKYEIWHDECKKDDYYHGILLVPNDKKEDIIKLLKQIRGEHNYPIGGNLKFVNRSTAKVGQVISDDLFLFSHLIKTKVNENTKIIKPSLGKNCKQYKPYIELRELFDCRFGLLKIRDGVKSMGGSSYIQRVETTFRFLLKNCCHGMFDDKHPIEITGFHFDGHNHYSRDINLQNIIKGDFRNYCKVAKNLQIDSCQMKDRDKDSKLLMNLVDNVIGAFVSKLTNELNDKTTEALSDIYNRTIKHKIFANKNSEWYKSVSLSELVAKDNNLEFLDIFRDKSQQKLF